MTAISLPIREAPAAHRGRALARLPMEIIREMGLDPGDPISIEGTARTHCRVVPGPSDAAAVEVDARVAERVGLAWGASARLGPAPLPLLDAVIVDVQAPVPPKPEHIAEALYDLPLTEGDRLALRLPLGRMADVMVTATDPQPAGLFTDKTVISIAGRPTALRYEGIGGLDDQIARVHEMVATPLERPDLFDRLGISAPRGILFTGPPGTGKTLLARAVAARTEAAFFHINAPEILSKHYGDSEAALRKVFDAAARQAPAVVFIDEIDAIAPRRDGLSGEKQVERRVVAQLLTLLDGLSDRGRIVVMAATNMPDALDPALRRPGRFDREVTFRPPSHADRCAILGVHLVAAPLDPGVDLDAIAAASHGYVGADLAAVAREAALSALSRSVTSAGGEAQVQAADLFVTQDDLEHGVAVTRPSVLRDTVVDSPVLGWTDIGGLEDVKSALQEAVIWPLGHRQMCQRLRLSPSRGLLLAGPPGSGKTLLARAIAGESGVNFIGVRPTRILSQFLGEAERAVADLFVKARQAEPAILFFDEFDSLAGRRGGRDAVHDRIVAQLLVELDGLTPNAGVTVLAATNRAAAIDPALMRPGRIDRVIEVPLPDAVARRAILEIHTNGRPLRESVDLDQVAASSSGLSGADLAALVEEAARAALRRALATSKTGQAGIEITPADFDSALELLQCTAAASRTDFIASGEACDEA